MPSAEIIRLTRRADKHDQDIRVLGDLLVEVKETVDQHTVQLTAIETRLDRVESRLDRVETRLDGVETRLGSVEDKLDQHGGMLVEILRRLAPAS